MLQILTAERTRENSGWGIFIVPDESSGRGNMKLCQFPTSQMYLQSNLS